VLIGTCRQCGKGKEHRNNAPTTAIHSPIVIHKRYIMGQDLRTCTKYQTFEVSGWNSQAKMHIVEQKYATGFWSMQQIALLNRWLDAYELNYTPVDVIQHLVGVIIGNRQRGGVNARLCVAYLSHGRHTSAWNGIERKHCCCSWVSPVATGVFWRLSPPKRISKASQIKHETL